MAASAALHRALLDFGERLSPPPPPRPASPTPVAPNFSRADLDAAVANAEARLHETLAFQHARATEAAVAEAVGQALAEARQRHAEEMQRLADEQAVATASAISNSMAALRGEVGAEVSAACARLLQPLLAEDAARRSIAALADALREALEDGGSFRVTLSGPARLRALLKEELAGLSADWQERDAAGLDLRVAFGTQILETKLAAWAETLVEAGA